MKNFVIPNMERPNANTLSDYLNSSMEAFSAITDIPSTYYSADNKVVREFKRDGKICNIFSIYDDNSSVCRRNLSSAGQFASRLGEPYIFLCKAGLANIAVSLIIDNTLAGYFIAGPIVMGELRGSIIRNFSELNCLNEATSSMANMFVGKMRVYQPNEVSQIALLFYNCIITSVSGDNTYSALRSQYNEQNEINTSIQHYKKVGLSFEYPYALEHVLIDNVRNGQIEAAKQNTEKMLSNFSILEAGDLEGIKAKTLWLFAIVIRIASENNNNLDQIIDIDLDVIGRITDTGSYDQLLAVSETIIELITKNMLSSIYGGKSQIITKALQFINRHPSEKISLNDIEENLHVNSSYFSTLFKQEMGVTFTDYLNSLKMDHACQLLADTNMSIIDISLSTGFEDQSYFSKVFKKSKGMTPKEYRAAYGTKGST